MSVRVLVVDDSVVIRRLVTQALAADPTIEVVGVAANGRLALGKVEQLAPDLVTMDIEMPELDGISTVRALRAAGQRMPIIMFSTLTERGAAATLEALAAGATDYVAKPSGVGGLQEGLRRVAEELVPKIHALVPGRRRTEQLTAARTTTAATATAAPTLTGRGPVRLRALTPRTTPVRAVVIGSSTGGPAALAELVGGLGEAPPVPVAVVQHMPAVFTRQLADRLDRIGPATVVEATDGEALLPGHVYVAPGGRHLLVASERGGLRARLTDTPPVNYSRPSVDVLFRSAVAALGGELLAVVLTGMGADGAAGSGQVADAGGTVLVQDEATSVVWGMPGATAVAGHAHAVLPLPEIASAMRRVMGEARR
ncbi:two-component system, chemotaxis family, response regulator CheB [Georgenia satyanarayanai]|uniref:Protein-glutamate methylesterase/protein-glutamine glutaminase n=1 Tax=Georgenia satyanarayanai TaxID=860221 RepID=A0A2Y9A4D8_9MICO|nr:chemotaxis response regulator protein-glutamate methylesterase [Georgenia satyanarayanai]PYG01045.1 two-component system chemotaxis response regulator CheB [Georgenia satyanarayanai]SSA39284.1 two-component system, chemotaxis family, response regulator CheB [Georgenia satyanarayanai]